MAWDNGNRKVIIETDSTDVLALIRGNINMEHQEHAAIMEKKRLLSREWVVQVSHVAHECNQTADWLAKKGFSAPSSFHAVHHLPVDLATIIDRDKGHRPSMFTRI